MGNGIDPIIFGGAKVYNAEKTEVKYDAKNKPIYCVWLDGGAYAEYPQQKQEPVVSYYAIEVETDMAYPITEKTYKSNVTTKDGIKFKFDSNSVECPSIKSEKVGEYKGKPSYEQTIDGFNGITLTATKYPDGIYVSNTSDANIVTDNDIEQDALNIMVNCKNVNYQVQDGIDEVSRWVGYEKNSGYSPKFKDK